MSRYDSIGSVKNPVLNEYVKDFFSLNNYVDFSNGATKGSVLKGMEYRPDLVAEYYLNDCSLAWIITIANNFTNGIEDYYLGRRLIIPSLDVIRSLL